LEADERDWRELYDDSRVHANRRSGFATPDANVTAADDDDNNNLNNFRSEVQFVFVFSQFPATEEATTTETNSSADLLNAEAIYESNNITTDSDVENLVIVIPDNSLSQYEASPSSALFQGFLPGSATVVRRTNVTWINADVNVTHGIILSGGEGEATGQIFEEASIPYQNGTSYMFDEEGEYTFADSISRMTGTITVVESAEEDDPRTNVTRPTVGLMAVPAYDEARFSPHLNRLGFNGVSSFWVGGGAEDDDTTTGGGGSGSSSSGEDSRLVLYVWSQEESDAQTVINRFASKLRTLEGILYPGGEVKQS
jgi:plastocyanin